MNRKQKRRVAILFGGKSAEHEVSLASAVGIMNHINRNAFDVRAVRISREGQWEFLRSGENLDSTEALEAAKGIPVVLGGPDNGGLLVVDRETRGKIVEAIDVVFPVLHGNQGEDGTVQGLVQLAGLPCVGAGVLASALCMDKILMKQVFFQNDLPAVDFLWFLRSEWESRPKKIVEGIGCEIGYPCFVKPANTGSSIGVTMAHQPSEIRRSIEEAVRYDRKVLVEKAVKGKELECSVLGNEKPEASVVGQIVPCHEFYDYDAKYIVEGTELIIPADLPGDVAERVQSMAVRAFKAVDCAGMARVDFFFEEATQRVLLNEVNTIPGFTPISMYPKLWEASGLSYTDLIARLIELAVERHEDLKRNLYLKVKV